MHIITLPSSIMQITFLLMLFCEICYFNVFVGHFFHCNQIIHSLFLFQFFNLSANEFHAKLVLKPTAADRRWKFIYEPLHGDIRLLSKKIPLTKYLNLQVFLFYLKASQVLNCICMNAFAESQRIISLFGMHIQFSFHVVLCRSKVIKFTF